MPVVEQGSRFVGGKLRNRVIGRESRQGIKERRGIEKRVWCLPIARLGNTGRVIGKGKREKKIPWTSQGRREMVVGLGLDWDRFAV